MAAKQGKVDRRAAEGEAAAEAVFHGTSPKVFSRLYRSRARAGAQNAPHFVEETKIAAGHACGAADPCPAGGIFRGVYMSAFHRVSKVSSSASISSASARMSASDAPACISPSELFSAVIPMTVPRTIISAMCERELSVSVFILMPDHIIAFLMGPGPLERDVLVFGEAHRLAADLFVLIVLVAQLFAQRARPAFRAGRRRWIAARVGCSGIPPRALLRFFYVHTVLLSGKYAAFRKKVCKCDEKALDFSVRV